MRLFFMVFGFGMMCFFGVIALASLFMFFGQTISGTQFLLLIPACLAGVGLAAELFDYGTQRIK